MKNAQVLTQSLLIFILLCSGIYADNIIINTDSESYVLEVDPQESIGSLSEKINSLIDTAENVFIEVSLDTQNPIIAWPVKLLRRQGQYFGDPRNYYASLTDKERGDIRYIVTTLAKKPTIALVAYKTALEEAGDRINKVHPLLFLKTVFTDEEMKVGMRNIQAKGWVWSDFMKGLKESLSTEASFENMKYEYVLNFAAAVDVSSDLIYPAIESQAWDQFVDLLIKHVPRKGNHGRYDC